KGFPSAPLEKDGLSVLTLIKKEYPSCLTVRGKKEIEGGLVHRLDTDTDGLLLIAETQEFYDYIQEVQERGLFIKTYSALCKSIPPQIEDGYPPCPYKLDGIGGDCQVSSYFRHYGPSRKCVRPVSEQSTLMAKKKAGTVLYSTNVKIKGIEGEAFQVECKIAKGFRHQVRCHLAWLGLPVIGDKLYNPAKADGEMLFSATGMEFPLPQGDHFSIKI
ncbi:MAG: RNA pseudouridine synthase, partial [Treponema sp.]|nr:RNA pseudouridine synthase [Treponema sp.]